MIKLLLLIPTLDRSGAEKQLTLLATRLPRDEFDVRVVALTRGGPYAEELADHHVPVTVLGKRFKFDPVAFLKLRRLLRDEPPDVLHTWLFAANAYGRLAAGSKPRFPILVSERCVDTWKSGWQLRLDRRLVTRTTRLIGNSQSVAQFYAQHGFPRERLVVIPNGVDEDENTTLSLDQLSRDKLGIPANARVIGYVGRLAPQKRVRDLLWAFELVRVLQDDVVFLVIGDGPERERLQKFAREIQVENRVRFLGHRDDVRQLLSVMDVFWLASEFEGQSNSVMEAMAAGLPVVVSDIPPNRELVTHGETGYVVPVGDRVAFAQFTERLLTDSALARQLGDAARERIRDHFGVARMLESYANLYREVAQKEPGFSEKPGF